MIKKETKLENATIELEIELPNSKVEIEYKHVFEKIRKLGFMTSN